MSRPPSSQTTPQFYRVSDRDLTEIELHSVDSINDLHRTHHEHSHKVQQGGAVRMLTEAVREKDAAATELSLLIQELQALRHNLTAMRGGT
ncbi:uncharacterized protein si:dkey-20d21.12 isoform X2 [Siniperca chuatsi]|uniref:uncharacterized protein si:dkey-20d21.12 isoform X2 n=1 Tax=Siniperca chuatsi TaxID=119488 RepID=UPI001CE0EB4C|nr:uncharacterized protein si:dkey-20d21.12 isoform X2 [Siniperca chuatsi]